jgi:nucleoid DNA-binding protein
MTTVTRPDLTEAAYLKCGASRDDAGDLVDQCLAMISDALVAGDRVGIKGFGSFAVRQKRA